MHTEEGLLPETPLLGTVAIEEIGTTSAITMPELSAVDRIAAHEIDDILHNREIVYRSFRQPDVIDPLDLQQERIAHLQKQRVELLRLLHMEQAAEAMRDPQIYFEGIVSQFFEECGPGRRVYSRATYISSNTIAEKAYTGTFRHDSNGIIEPELQALIGLRSYEIDGIKSTNPTFFVVRTDLQNTKPGYEYEFRSSETGLLITASTKMGMHDQETYEVTDPIDRFTLLQALTVDMQAALLNRQPESDARFKSIIERGVYGSRNL